MLKTSTSSYVLNIKKESGDTLLEFPFKSKSFLHPSLDLVLLHLEDEQAVTRELEEHGLRVDHVQLSSSSLDIEGKVSHLNNAFAQ